jgi:hypothetical protein
MDVNTQKKEKQHNVEFAKGGKTKMFSQQSADPAEKGETADITATDQLSNKFAGGGKTKMFGFAGAQSAQAGMTSAR